MNEDQSNDFATPLEEEIGSDELLAADNLSLPVDANVLVRLHAMRAWLSRRSSESELAIGNAALLLQQTAQNAERKGRVRQRPLSDDIQRQLTAAQRRLNAYDEASQLLDDCVVHTTIGERLLVEYYLALEERLQAPDSPTDTPWIESMQDVLRRVEQIGTPEEDEN